MFGHWALSRAVRLTLHQEVKGKIPQNQHNNSSRTCLRRELADTFAFRF